VHGARVGPETRPLSDHVPGPRVARVRNRTPAGVGAVVAGIILMGCGSGSSGPGASATSSPASSATTAPSTSAPSTSTPPLASAPAATTTAATCPTLAQANLALGATYSGPVTHATAGGGIVCEYTGAGGSAAVAIFANQSATVFAGQVANAPGAPAMPKISGVGDGAFGSTIAGRSIVNAYSNSSRTLVAAQAPGALPPVEALARVALADN
jgi:hypothetical protein